MMRRPCRHVVVAVIAVALALAGDNATTAQDRCADCTEAAFWEVDPHSWRQEGAPDFPERAKLEADRRYDVGVAFSGGGTRAAAATIGQLRGLNRNGWLDRVRYLTAVSGGSWAAVPYVYFDGRLDDLLGAYLPSGGLTPELVTKTPSGRLAGRVVNSGLGHVGLQEVPQFLPDEVAGLDITLLRDTLSTLRKGLRRWRGRSLPEPDRRDKAYAHMLGQVFLGANRDDAALVDRANVAPYTWDRATASSLSATTAYPATEMVQVPPNRPFLIVGGTLIWQRPGLAYPRLIPVEYTPLYTGIRQQFGSFGGTYVSPWAYDRRFVTRRSDGRMLVSPGPAGRTFTLADVIASSGAAPQLALLLGDGVPARLREQVRTAAGAFPSFANLAVRRMEPVPTGDVVPHGDGGFTDNLGLMPLLARQVQHIIVFVNSNRTWARNDQLQSYFISLSVKDGSGDKSMNQVFESDRYKEVLDGLDDAMSSGGPAVYCGKTAWSVKANELYNIRGYKNLKICWVYNHAASSWKTLLPPTIQAWLDWTPKSQRPRSKEVKDLEAFPYYATFGENKPRAIKLTALQVNLLADLACWSVTNPVTTRRIVHTFGEHVLPPVPVDR